jgi:hypothetical protein
MVPPERVVFLVVPSENHSCFVRLPPSGLQESITCVQPHCRYSERQMCLAMGDLWRHFPDPRNEVGSGFARLRRPLQQARQISIRSFEAKYSMTDTPSSCLLGTVRGELYNPRRPPADSKALEKQCGQNGYTLTLNMIGVAPKGRENRQEKWEKLRWCIPRIPDSSRC